MGAFEDFFQNDVAGALNPRTNGVGDFFQNDVKNFVTGDLKNFITGDLKNFFTHDVAGFFKNTVGPVVQNLIDIVVVLPLQMIKNLFSAGNNIVSGNGLYYLIGGIFVVTVVGGVIYYKMTH